MKKQDDEFIRKKWIIFMTLGVETAFLKHKMWKCRNFLSLMYLYEKLDSPSPQKNYKRVERPAKTGKNYLHLQGRQRISFQNIWRTLTSQWEKDEPATEKWTHFVKKTFVKKKKKKRETYMAYKNVKRCTSCYSRKLKQQQSIISIHQDGKK